MTFLSTLVDWLEDSGWATLIYNSGVARVGIAKSYSSGSNVVHSRYCHQVTICAMSQGVPYVSRNSLCLKEFPISQGVPFVSRSSLCLKEFPMSQGVPYVLRSSLCLKEFPMSQGVPYVSRSSLCLKEFPMSQGVPYASEICLFNVQYTTNCLNVDQCRRYYLLKRFALWNLFHLAL